MAFTTWRELHTQLLDDLASGSFRTMRGYTVATGGGTRTVQYRDLRELRELIDWAEEEAEKEEGRAYIGRTYAQNGGRG